MEERSTRRRAEGQAGFALIMALLALMLLTFLGLTLATSTSTELQISNNYRWSLQAFYNAEAGLEAAKALLSQIGDASMVLPDPRAGWIPNYTTPGPANPPNPRYARPDAFGAGTRNFENSGCDVRGAGAGYGAVFDDGTTNLQNVSTLFGQNLRGAFTVWIRRPIIVDPATGNFMDNPNNEVLVLVSEGTAPYTGAATNFAQERRARRILEEEVTITPPCDPGKPQGSTFGGCWQ
jgi:hypothetical protein